MDMDWVEALEIKVNQMQEAKAKQEIKERNARAMREALGREDR